MDISIDFGITVTDIIKRDNGVLSHEMTLTKQVEEALRSSQADLREALAFSARAEKPYIVREIGGMISHIDNLISTDGLFERMDKVIQNLEKETDE